MGDSISQTDCPPETGATSEAEGVDKSLTAHCPSLIVNRFAPAFSLVASDYSSGSAVYFGTLRPLRERYFFTQRAQRAQRFILFRVSRWRWRGRKLRYDKRAQRVYPPPPPYGVLAPVSGGERPPLNPPAGGGVSHNRLVPTPYRLSL